LIFNGEFIHKHCLTGISKLETFDESAHGMSTDNKLVMFDVTGLPTENVMYQENWSLALERLLMMVGLSMQNLMANKPLAPHLGLSNTKLAAVSFFHEIT